MRKYFYLIFTVLLLVLSIPTVVFAVSSFQAEADKYLNRVCNHEKVSRIDAVLCSFRDRLSLLETNSTNQGNQLDSLSNDVANNSADIVSLKTKKAILDVGQVRGSGLDIDAPTTPIKTPGEITVNCSKACILWVNYDVDTRNTQIPANGWYQHLYHIFIDDVDQAVYNQVSATVVNAAYPLAVNGVFPVSAGEHTVSIYVKVTGGHLQQFTSHLQVLAIEQ